MEGLQKQARQADTFRDRFREVVTAPFAVRHRRFGEVAERRIMGMTGVHQMDTEHGSQDIQCQEQAECPAAGTTVIVNLVIHQGAFPDLSMLASSPDIPHTPASPGKMPSF